MISKRELIAELEMKKSAMHSAEDGKHYCAIETIIDYIKGFPTAGKWIPFKEREADAEEREVYGCDAMLACKLLDEDEDILVTYANGRVGFDTFLREEYECYLDSGAQFISEAVAWMPLPEPMGEK